MQSNNYLEYRRRYKNRKTRLERGEFRAVVDLFNKKVIDRIIFNNFEFKITGLGVLSLRKKKLKVFKEGKINGRYLPIDWVKTKQYNKRIFILNEHTDGYKYFFQFDKFNHKNKKYYNFKVSRRNSRYLAKVLKNPDIYGKVDAFIK